MSFEDEKLVECLKANPCLWDKNRQDFRLSAMKDAKWKEIAAELDSTPFKAIRRYRTLRERFRRESIKYQRNANYVSKWILYDKISFLKEFQIPRTARFADKFAGLNKQYAIDRNVNADNETVDTVSRQQLDDKINVPGIDADDGDELPRPFEETRPNRRLSDHGSDAEEEEEEVASLASADEENDEWIAQTTDQQMTANKMTNNARRINVITTFCQYIKANLNRMTEEQIDRVIEDMTVMLFRRKRAFRRSCDARF